MTFLPIVTGSGLAAYSQLKATRETQETRLAQSSNVARDLETFKSQIGSVQSSEDLMDNRVLLRISLGAFGLEEDLNNRAFIQQILDSDLEDSTSLANRLSDKRYLAFAQTFNFQGEDGPQISEIAKPKEVNEDLAKLETPSDLLSNPALLRATLRTFGLEGDASNTYFLEQILESDTSDPESFVNQIGDPAYIELAETFDFASKARNQDTIYGFAKVFEGKFETLETTSDLMSDPELLTEALRIFGLEGEINRTEFLENVFNSDIDDDASYANSLDDPRYAALADAFGFGEPDPVVDPNADPNDPLPEKPPSKAENLVTTVLERDEPAMKVSDFMTDFELYIDTGNFFNVPQNSRTAGFMGRVLESDASDPNSLVNIITDERYLALSRALNFESEVSERQYTNDFVEAVTSNYIERQFEIAVGNTDANLRIALSFERDLNEVVERGTTNDTYWFSIMGSRPLRAVFETAFQLPTGFGRLDVDRQLSDFKDRSQALFGTDQVKDFLEPETLSEIRSQFLTQSALGSQSSTISPNSAALTLLGGF
jgi:hypothetical protein